MASNRITVRLGSELGESLRRRARLTGKDESALVRAALEQYLSRSPGEVSAFQAARAAGLIGAVKLAPPDLSTNKKYFRGFGESK